MKQNDLQKQVLNLKEVSQYTGLSMSYLYKKTHKNEIPFYKPNGKIIFIDRLELEAWLKRNRNKTIDELKQEAINKVMLNS
ncbi:MAG TPA: helix-turn-helix domain-containing protein [Bacteroidia bacterium]|nr:helix-turn-helix domain-containing protein [Bacteroidia bacterium]HRS57988.1 helix-turn-helix domain-containing protein [Bacteroidia bacterium]HRU68557.1 helix-turn-helix domain-containing protein [Bacteroidia bacterium]